MQDTSLSPAARWLDAQGFPVPELHYEFHLGGGTKDAAKQLGLDEHHIIKSLLFDNGASGAKLRAVMVLTHGDTRVSLHKLERLAGIRHLQPSAPDTVLRLTGYQPGGVCPFALPKPLLLCVQESLLALSPLYINAGRRGIVVPVPIKAIQNLFPRISDIHNTNSRR